MLPPELKPEKSKTQHSDLRSCLARLSSDLELWSSHLMESRNPRTPRKCIWSFMSVTGVFKWISQVSSLVPERVVFSKFLVVSLIFLLLLDSYQLIDTSHLQVTITALQTPIKKRLDFSSRKAVSPMRTRTKTIHPRCLMMPVLRANLKPTLPPLLFTPLLRKPRVAPRVNRRRLANDHFH